MSGYKIRSLSTNGTTFLYSSNNDSNTGDVLAGRRNSMACAALNNSMASIRSRLRTTRRSLVAALDPHTHMVFLSVGGDNRVDGSWCTELFVLAYNGCCCILWNHEAGVESGISYQECWQTAQATDELIGPAFADITELSQGNRKIVQWQGKRLSMEVAGRNDEVFIRENSWIVGHRIDLGKKVCAT